MPPIPSKKSQLVLLQLLTDYTVREIRELFVGNGLRRTAPYSEEEWPVGGSQRRDLAASEAVRFDLCLESISVHGVTVAQHRDRGSAFDAKR